MRIILLMITCAIVVSSCNTQPVTVMVDKIFTDTNTVSTIVFDGKDSFAIKDTAIAVQLKPGNHSFVLNNQTAKEFTVGENGGLLNLDNQEYIVHEIEYAATQQTNMVGFNPMRVKAVVLLDSNIIIPKNGASIKSDSMLQVILPKLQAAKNGNYFGFLHQKNLESYDTNETIAGIKKFGKDKLYIERFWDYTLNQTIPKTLEVRVNKNALFSSSTTTRSSIMPAKMFLLYAMFNKEEYIVKSIQQINERIQQKTEQKK